MGLESLKLESLKLEPDPILLPPIIDELIEQAWEQIQLFMTRKRDHPVHGFQPSEFAEAYRWLALVHSLISNTTSPRLCEWGSGFGVVSVLAESLGFSVTAIESDRDLFEAGRDWQRSVGSRIQNCHGSFIPRENVSQLSSEVEQGLLGPASNRSDSMWLDLDSIPVYGDAGFGPDSFDVIYAYPWPGEELFIFRLFELVAGPGTILLSFHGAADFRLHRKMNQER